MRDNQSLMIAFVKLIQQYPEIYNQNLDTYRTRHTEIAWAKVATHIRNDLHEECTIEELKVKWKGIRSSFNRYRGKLNSQNNDLTFKKYYLHDHLKFLEPFLRNNYKGFHTKPHLDDSEDHDKSETFTDTANFINVNSCDETQEYSEENWSHIEIKPDVDNTQDVAEILDPTRSSCPEASYKNIKKRKHSSEAKDSEDDDSEDLIFFKSILPDIRSFTNREKRKLKMGILQLIDQIEIERKCENND